MSQVRGFSCGFLFALQDGLEESGDLGCLLREAKGRGCRATCRVGERRLKGNDRLIGFAATCLATKAMDHSPFNGHALAVLIDRDATGQDFVLPTTLSGCQLVCGRRVLMNLGETAVV